MGSSLRHLWLYIAKCFQSWTNKVTKRQFRFGLRKTKPTTITKEKFSLWMLEGDQGPGREGDGQRPPETAVCPREFSLPGRLQSFSPGRQLTKLVNQDGISSLSKSFKATSMSGNLCFRGWLLQNMQLRSSCCYARTACEIFYSTALATIFTECL